MLRARVADGSLVPGTVLLEGKLARIFGASRSPVHQALEALAADGVVSRFDGRGLVVGDGSAPLRRDALDAAAFDPGTVRITRAWGWQNYYGEVERQLALRCVFGAFQVNEVELAAYLGIGRTVAHDLLVRIEAAGLIRKDGRARWMTVPLDERRVADLYGLRSLLEPAAVAGAVGRVPRPALHAMLARLEAATASYPQVESPVLDRLEQDLHVELIGHTANIELPQALRRTRGIIISSKHLLGSVVALPDRDPFLEEHRAVLLAVARAQPDQAAHAMLAHLASARVKVTERLRAARARTVLPALPYVDSTTPASGDAAA